MKSAGLTLATPSAHRIRSSSTWRRRRQSSSLRADDVLVLTTKTQQTEALLERHRRAPGRGVGNAAEQLPDVVCVQNGVENERDRVAALLAYVHAICVMLPAEHLKQADRGRVVGAAGCSVCSTSVAIRLVPTQCAPSRSRAAALADSTFESIVRPEDVMRWKYRKTAAKSREFDRSAVPVTTSTRLPRGSSRSWSSGSTAEGREVLAAAGIDVVGDEEWKAYRQ